MCIQYNHVRNQRTSAHILNKIIKNKIKSHSVVFKCFFMVVAGGCVGVLCDLLKYYSVVVN